MLPKGPSENKGNFSSFALPSPSTQGDHEEQEAPEEDSWQDLRAPSSPASPASPAKLKPAVSADPGPVAVQPNPVQPEPT